MGTLGNLGKVNCGDVDTLALCWVNGFSLTTKLKGPKGEMRTAATYSFSMCSQLSC